jgi:AraC family transcriptional regulator
MPVEHAAPVSMGSPRFNTLECGSFLVTEAFFPAGHKIARHFHDRAVVGLTRVGEWDSMLGSVRLANTPGALHIEPAGDSHANAFSSDTFVTIIQPDPRDDRLAESFRTLFETGCQIPLGLPGILIAERICNEFLREDDLTPLTIESLSLDLLVSSVRADRCRKSGGQPWLTHALEYLHERFLERPTLDQLGQIAGVTPEHFNREFRRRYHVGAAEYIRRLRLDWAAEQLRTHTKSIADIASVAGFSDQSHFTRHFRRRFGMTPAAFRAASLHA